MKIQQQLGTFVAAAGKLTAFGIVGLAITAILLLLTIEGSFNKIFRVAHARPLVIRLVVLWAMLTVTPFLMAISLSLFGYFSVFVPRTVIGEFASVAFGQVAPALLSWGGFTLLYALVPNKRVRWQDALIGAGFSAVLFALLRAGFGLYVKGMTSYSAIYGALAAVPVFLLWIYLIWFVIMAGAVITAALPDWRLLRAGLATGPALKLAIGLELLNCLSKAFNSGRQMTPEQLALTVSVPEAVVLPVLEELRLAGYVAVGETGRWMLSRDLSKVPLIDLVHKFGFGLGPAAKELRDSTLGERVSQHLKAAVQSEQELLQVSLARVVGGEDRTA